MISSTFTILIVGLLAAFTVVHLDGVKGEEYESMRLVNANFTLTFTLHTNKRNYSDATDFCKMAGGFLAEIHSPVEMELITTLARVAGNYTSVWLGGSDEQKEGTWTWTNSRQEISKEFWADGEPNNARGNEHFLEFGYFRKLNDWICDHTEVFICEVITISKPSEPITVTPNTTTTTTTMEP